MSDLSDLAIVQCARNTEAFVDYIQTRDKTLARAEATWIAAAILRALPALFSANEPLLESLDRAVSEFKAAAREEH